MQRFIPNDKIKIKYSIYDILDNNYLLYNAKSNAYKDNLFYFTSLKFLISGKYKIEFSIDNDKIDNNKIDKIDKIEKIINVKYNIEEEIKENKSKRKGTPSINIF